MKIDSIQTSFIDKRDTVLQKIVKLLLWDQLMLMNEIKLP